MKYNNDKANPANIANTTNTNNFDAKLAKLSAIDALSYILLVIVIVAGIGTLIDTKNINSLRLFASSVSFLFFIREMVHTRRLKQIAKELMKEDEKGEMKEEVKEEKKEEVNEKNYNLLFAGCLTGVFGYFLYLGISSIEFAYDLEGKILMVVTFLVAAAALFGSIFLEILYFVKENSSFRQKLPKWVDKMVEAALKAEQTPSKEG